MDIDARGAVGLLRHDPGNDGHPQLIQLMGEAVGADGHEGGVGQNDLLPALGGGIPLIGRVHIRADELLDVRQALFQRVRPGGGLLGAGGDIAHGPKQLRAPQGPLQPDLLRPVPRRGLRPEAVGEHGRQKMARKGGHCVLQSQIGVHAPPPFPCRFNRKKIAQPCRGSQGKGGRLTAPAPFPARSAPRRGRSG